MFDFSFLLFSQQANNRKISIAPSCGKSIEFEILPIILSDVQIHLMCRPAFFRSNRCVIEKLMHICFNLSSITRALMQTTFYSAYRITTVFSISKQAV